MARVAAKEACISAIGASLGEDLIRPQVGFRDPVVGAIFLNLALDLAEEGHNLLETAAVQFLALPCIKSPADFSRSVGDFPAQEFVDGLLKFPDDLSSKDEEHQSRLFEHIGVIEDLGLQSPGDFRMSFVGQDTVAHGINFALFITQRREHLRGHSGPYRIMCFFSMIRATEPDVVEKHGRDQHGVIHAFFLPCDEKSTVEVAQDVGATLICAGTTGKSGIERLLIGSVARRLLHDSKVPLLLSHDEG